MLEVTAKQLIYIAPGAKKAPNLDSLVSAINHAADRFQINQTPRRLRYFLAQTAYESQDFTRTEENLYYLDAARVARIFRYGFDLNRNGVVDPEEIVFAQRYTRNPEGLANRAYANRMGNGPEESGDGWKYRGRGLIQLTFLANYHRASMGLYGDLRLVDNPDLVSERSTYITAVETAGYYWSVNGLNAMADRDEFSRVTGKIHGSLATVERRLSWLRRANEAIRG